VLAWAIQAGDIEAFTPCLSVMLGVRFGEQ
jgi:hypothetical protein